MNNQDHAAFTCNLKRLAADCGTQIAHCIRTGQLSRSALLHEAREKILQAANLPHKDEQQLTLDVSHEEKF